MGSLATQSDPPDYSIFGESPLGFCHRGGTFVETITYHRLGVCHYEG